MATIQLAGEAYTPSSLASVFQADSFDLKAPKTGTMTVATKAVAVAKAKATRMARGTKGPKAKLVVTGNAHPQHPRRRARRSPCRSLAVAAVRP